MVGTWHAERRHRPDLGIAWASVAGVLWLVFHDTEGDASGFTSGPSSYNIDRSDHDL